MVGLNLEAANLLIAQSVFFPALEVLKAGLLDGIDKWVSVELYDLSLKVSNEFAARSYATVDFVFLSKKWMK